MLLGSYDSANLDFNKTQDCNFTEETIAHLVEEHNLMCLRLRIICLLSTGTLS